MEENKNLDKERVNGLEEKSYFDFQAIYTTIILNWKWFLLSLSICLGTAFLYLRYTTPIYQAYAKMLIKNEENRKGGNSLRNAQNLGVISYSNGIDNEMEILGSLSIAEQTVRDLKLYTTYMSEGRITDRLLYKTQPVTVDIDPSHLDKLNAPISLSIKKEGANYNVTGTYYVPTEDGGNTGPYSIEKTFSTLPQVINTRTGLLTFSANGTRLMSDGEIIKVNIVSPRSASYKYAGSLTVAQTSKTTTIARLSLVDEIPERAMDYLNQIVKSYNRQANEDKNEIAFRTEKFINGRLEKIHAELGSTEGQLENYKKRNRMVELNMSAGQAMTNANEYEQKLADANTQVALLNSISEYIKQPGNKYEVLPSNIGLQDPSSTNLINRYNEIVLERKRLLRSASENSPTVMPLTDQLNNLEASIKQAIGQSRRNLQIQRNSVASQFGKYSGDISMAPEQERMLNQIGRQQELKSGLYLMLLQKREENSISLAATADNGKLLDRPQYGGKVSPNSSIILLMALIIGLGLPTLVIFIMQFFKYKIEGHDDVVRLTKLPILAEVAVASETAKTKADIVVHENKNNQMEEIFRSMRTNLQFILKEHQNVIMFTSTTSGEGKTFNAANLAVSFALLGKKVILLGLDIRKPRLAELFEINDHKHGITQLLVCDTPTEAQIKDQILPSGVNDYLDIMLAGPIPPNPTELLARNSLDKIVEVLRNIYDYILIDTAPVGLVSDTLQIGRIADATIYMCRADYTPKTSFYLVNSLDEERKLPNMSIVLNGIDMSKKKYGYYYGYGKYGKYGRYGNYGNKSKRGGQGNYGYGYGYGHYGKSSYGDKNDTSIKL